MTGVWPWLSVNPRGLSVRKAMEKRYTGKMLAYTELEALLYIKVGVRVLVRKLEYVHSSFHGTSGRKEDTLRSCDHR
jgi:hypothetical protein